MQRRREQEEQRQREQEEQRKREQEEQRKREQEEQHRREQEEQRRTELEDESLAKQMKSALALLKPQPVKETCPLMVCKSKKARTWIACDNCEQWYHMKCVGLTAKKAKSLIGTVDYVDYLALVCSYSLGRAAQKGAI